MSRAPTGHNVNALTEQLESANDLIGLLKDQLRKARNENDATRQMHRLRINTIESEKIVLRDQLESAERLIESLKEDKKNLKKDLRYAEDKIDDLKEDKKDLKQSLRDLICPR
jgi:chromosome segregation ATPase